MDKIMGQIKPHAPVKLIIGIIIAKLERLEPLHQRLSEQFGAIDFASQILPFDYTPYYEPEMGGGLKRQFVSFESLIVPDELAPIKHLTNEIETEYALDSGARQVNLDPGYISAAKLVLASTKDHAHRIYLRQGIYAEITLRFHRKTFQPWEWTYPDYRTPAYIGIFNHIRHLYMEQLKAHGLSAHPL
jgi:hypothetical protein